MGRKKRVLDFDEIIANPHRKGIMDLCIEPKSASYLKKVLKIGPASLYHHLGILEKAKL